MDFLSFEDELSFSIKSWLSSSPNPVIISNTLKLSAMLSSFVGVVMSSKQIFFKNMFIRIFTVEVQEKNDFTQWNQFLFFADRLNPTSEWADQQE